MIKSLLSFLVAQAIIINPGGSGGGGSSSIVGGACTDQVMVEISTDGTPTCADITDAMADGATGTGDFVFATSPTLVTPDLGTPSALTLTNATGLPVSTGISGLGAGVADFLGTPSSANLATAVTGETGSGALTFATAPVFTTSIDIGSAGVRISDDGDGAITFLGLGDGNDEDLTFNFDDTADQVVLTTSTGVTRVTFSSLGIGANKTFTDTSGSPTLVSHSSSYNPGAPSTANQTTLSSDLSGTISGQTHSGTLTGVSSRLSVFGSGGTLTNGTVFTATGVLTGTSNPVITNLKYFNVGGLTVTAGTITNTYGYYVGDITAGTQTNQAWGFYNSDTNARENFQHPHLNGTAGCSGTPTDATNGIATTCSEPNLIQTLLERINELELRIQELEQRNK